MIHKRCFLNSWKKVPLPASKLKSLAAEVFGSLEAIPESAKYVYKEQISSVIEVRFLQNASLILETANGCFAKSNLRLILSRRSGPTRAAGRSRRTPSWRILIISKQLRSFGRPELVGVKHGGLSTALWYSGCTTDISPTDQLSKAMPWGTKLVLAVRSGL